MNSTVTPHLKRQDPTSPSTPTESIPANNGVTVPSVENFSSGLIYTEAATKTTSVNDISNLFSSIKRGNYQHFLDIIKETYQGESEYYKVHYLKGMWDSTPLLVAIQYHQTEMIDYLLAHLPPHKIRDADNDKEEFVLNHRNEKGATAMLFAVMEGLTTIVQQLIKLDVTVNIPATVDAIYNPLYDQSMIATPLSLAVANQQCEILKLLLAAGCKVNTPFDFPTVKSATASVGGKSNGVKGLTPILLSCNYGHLDVVRELLTHDDIDCEVNDEEFANILHHLARSKKAQPNNNPDSNNPVVGIFQELMKKEVITMGMLQQRDKNSDTPLHIACDNKQVDLVKLLLEEGSNPSSMNSNTGFTPLHIAIRRRQIDIVKLLLEYGADPLAKIESKAGAQSPVEMSNKLSSDNEIHVAVKQAIESRNTQISKDDKILAEPPFGVTGSTATITSKSPPAKDQEEISLSISSSKQAKGRSPTIIKKEVITDTNVSTKNESPSSKVSALLVSEVASKADQPKKKSRSTFVAGTGSKQASPVHINPSTEQKNEKKRSTRSTFVSSSPSKKGSMDFTNSVLPTSGNKKDQLTTNELSSQMPRELVTDNKEDTLLHQVDGSNLSISGATMPLSVTSNGSSQAPVVMVSPRKDAISAYMEMQIVGPAVQHMTKEATPATKPVEKLSKKANQDSPLENNSSNLLIGEERPSSHPVDGAVTDFSMLANEEESFDLLLMKMLNTGQGDDQLEEYLKDHTNDYSRMEEEYEDEKTYQEEHVITEKGYKEQDMTMIDLSIIHDPSMGAMFDVSILAPVPQKEIKPQEIIAQKPTGKNNRVVSDDTSSMTVSSSKANKGDKSPRSTKSSSTTTNKKKTDEKTSLSNKSTRSKPKPTIVMDSNNSDMDGWNNSTVVSNNTPTKTATIKTSVTTGKKKTISSSGQRDILARENSTRLSTGLDDSIGIAALENNSVPLGSMTTVKVAPKPPTTNAEGRNAFKRRGMSGKINNDNAPNNVTSTVNRGDEFSGAIESNVENLKVDATIGLSLDLDIVESVKENGIMPNGFSTPKASRTKSDKEDENRGTESVPMTPISMLVSKVAHESPVVSTKSKISSGIAALSPGNKQKSSKFSGSSDASNLKSGAQSSTSKVGKSPMVRRKVTEMSTGSKQ